ncbi:MAG: hypothetical protein ABL901_10195 [Hyphomicrobiaceae bacterium]
MAAPLETLISYLIRRNELKGRALATQLTKAKVAGMPMNFGADDVKRDADQGSNSPEGRVLLIETISAALMEAVAEFDATDAKLRDRLKDAERYKTGSALLTTFLSSGVVASLSQAPTWTPLVSVLTVASALITTYITRVEDTNLAKDYGEITAKHAQARLMIKRLAAYKNNPGAFGDVDGRLEEAQDLVLFLDRIRGRYLA